MPAPLQSSRTHALSGPLREADPGVLWERVVASRIALRRERSQPANSSAHSVARDQVLRALEAYAACLAEQRRPIPYELRDELRLLRLTSSAERGY
jgi:hypothetical protein